MKEFLEDLLVFYQKERDELELKLNSMERICERQVDKKLAMLFLDYFASPNGYSSFSERYDLVRRAIKRIEFELRKLNNENVNEINLEDLKQNIRLEDLCDHYGIKIKKDIARCPFHEEDTASFKIYSKNNSFYCFGCGKGGSVIDFVMGIENVDIGKAIGILSRNA